MPQERTRAQHGRAAAWAQRCFGALLERLAKREAATATRLLDCHSADDRNSSGMDESQPVRLPPASNSRSSSATAAWYAGLRAAVAGITATVQPQLEQVLLSPPPAAAAAAAGLPRCEAEAGRILAAALADAELGLGLPQPTRSTSYSGTAAPAPAAADGTRNHGSSSTSSYGGGHRAAGLDARLERAASSSASVPGRHNGRSGPGNAVAHAGVGGTAMISVADSGATTAGSWRVAPPRRVASSVMPQRRLIPQLQ